MRRKNLLKKLWREDFSAFVGKAFEVVSPGCAYAHNWHIDALAERVRSVVFGAEIPPRLIVNMPPRCLKSVAISVALPAWLLGRDPGLRILTASHSAELADKMAQDCRLVMEEEWYRDAFPHTRIAAGENRRDRFVTEKRGFRRSVSVGGAVTGEGGDVLILDDPHNAMDVYSAKKRAFAVDWFEQSFLTRRNDPEKSAVIVVMQRLHERDLTGEILRRQPGLWRQFLLPAVETEERAVPLRRDVVARRPGDLLHSERLAAHTLDTLRRSLGEAAFAAQYLQMPQKGGGDAVIRREWLATYSEEEKRAATESLDRFVVQSWDTAFKTHESADYSVGVTLCVCASRYIALDVWRKRAAYPELREAVKNRAETFRPDVILIEDKASGQALLQELRDTGLPLRAVMPKEDKITRALRVASVFENGRVALPERASWKDAFVDELISFPDGDRDDQLDALVQAILWNETRGNARARVRTL
ncbi:MAG: phage terminase large subunit [Rickettsiales bacterium]